MHAELLTGFGLRADFVCCGVRGVRSRFKLTTLYCKGEFENWALLGLRKIPLKFYGAKGITLYMSGFWGWISEGHSNVA